MFENQRKKISIKIGIKRKTKIKKVIKDAKFSTDSSHIPYSKLLLKWLVKVKNKCTMKIPYEMAVVYFLLIFALIVHAVFLESEFKYSCFSLC